MNQSKNYQCIPPCSAVFSTAAQLRQHKAMVATCSQRSWNQILERFGGIQQSGDNSSSSRKSNDLNPGQDLGLDFDNDGFVMEWHTAANDEMEEIEIGWNEALSEHPPGEPDDEGLVIDCHPGAGEVVGKTKTVFQCEFERRQLLELKPWYPFSCAMEVEVATFLHESGLSQSSIDQFLHLSYVCQLVTCSVLPYLQFPGSEPTILLCLRPNAPC